MTIIGAVTMDCWVEHVVAMNERGVFVDGICGDLLTAKGRHARPAAMTISISLQGSPSASGST